MEQRKTYLIGCVVCGFRLIQSESEPQNSGCYACGSSLAKIEETSDEEVAQVLQKYGQKTTSNEESL